MTRLASTAEVAESMVRELGYEAAHQLCSKLAAHALSYSAQAFWLTVCDAIGRLQSPEVGR